jgi:hypothetical protein
MQQKVSVVDKAWDRLAGEIEAAYPGSVVTHSDAGFRAVYLGREFTADQPACLRSLLAAARSQQ